MTRTSGILEYEISQWAKPSTTFATAEIGRIGRDYDMAATGTLEIVLVIFGRHDFIAKWAADDFGCGHFADTVLHDSFHDFQIGSAWTG